MPILIAAVDRRERTSVRLVAALDGNFRIHAVDDGREATHLAKALGADGILFDTTVAGDDFAANARRSDPIRILVAWTPRSSSQLVADLIEAGADEVLHGAMSDRELVARTRAAVRPSRRPTGAVVEIGRLRLDAVHGEATWDGLDLGLTRRERELLEILAENPGRNVRRELVYRRVWGYAMARGERSVDVNVKRLRRKLARAAGDSLQVKTQPGVGYRLEVAAAATRKTAAAS